MRKFNITLPLIPESTKNTRAVFHQPPSEKPFPFFRGSGPADLLCGKCSFRLGQGIGVGQIKDLVLKCPKCSSYNDIPFIPALEQLVSEFLIAPDPSAKAVTLKAKLETAQSSGASQKEVSESIRSDSVALGKFLSLIEPKSAGDFYGMLGCIIAFLSFLVTLKQLGSPSVVVNQYVASQTVPPTASRGAACPCGSGKKFKLCHGRR